MIGHRIKLEKNIDRSLSLNIFYFMNRIYFQFIFSSGIILAITAALGETRKKLIEKLFIHKKWTYHGQWNERIKI